MAYSFMRTTVQTRSKGHTATGTVCYRFGLSATSTIPGADGKPRRFDYTRRTGIEARGFAAPPGNDPSWGDPVKWAHRIEAVDRRRNSRQCRDDVVAIPIELVEAGVAEEAAQAYAQQLAMRHKTVVHWVLHRPARGGKNYHGHFVYPGRQVEGLTFSRRRDREQDKPELVTWHKAVWSEICRGYGIELDWTSKTPGHHLGPALCAVKRGRLVEETREAIRSTLTASTPEEAVPDTRTLQSVAEIATRVNDGLTVNEMLERELEEVLRGEAAPRKVPGPAPFQPEVLPLASAPEVLPQVERAPEVTPPARSSPEILPPVKRAPEVVPSARAVPEVLPPLRQPEALPPVNRQSAVLPPREVTTRIIADRTGEQYPRETSATWSEVERHLELQRQTLAQERGRAAARELGEDARKRDRSRTTAHPAQSGRIRRIAEFVQKCTRQVLEYLGLEPDAAPERDVGQAPARAEASVAPPRQPPASSDRPEPSRREQLETREPEHAAADEATLKGLRRLRERLEEHRKPRSASKGRGRTGSRGTR